MTRKHRLRAWADPSSADVATTVPRPTPSQALYALPNPSGTRKSCHNCVNWLSGVLQCALMEEDVVVPPHAHCNYHVFGKQRPSARSEDAHTVRPEDVGFDQVQGGVSCDRCRHYTVVSPVDGKCAVIADPGEGNDYTVQALASCSWWDHV